MDPSVSAAVAIGPFFVGREYRVRHSFQALRDRFVEGEILIFDSSGWSRYDGITGYFFRSPDQPGLRLWDIYDDEDVGVWKEHFEEMPLAGKDGNETPQS